jgi:hypothetical protein
METMLSKYAHMIRINSDQVFSHYRNKYERIELSKRYLELGLPFYYNLALVETYTLKFNRKKEISTVKFTPLKSHWWGWSTTTQTPTEQTLKTEEIFSKHGFIPYALCHVFDVLVFLPEELCKMCVKYFLHPDASSDLIVNENCRILDFDYPKPKKRNNTVLYDSDDD